MLLFQPPMHSLLLLTSFISTVLSLPNQIPIQPQDHSEGYKFEPLHHLPGISRYFDAVGFGLKHVPPLGCKVTAASYLIRHSAIHANEAEYEEYIEPFIQKLNEHRGQWSGPLDFLNKWQSPILEDKLEDVTLHGLIDAEMVGEHLHKRYPHLVSSVKKVLTDKKARCKDTAHAIIKGFPHSASIEVKEFAKPKDGSMNPIIPHKSCHGFSKEPGQKEMWEFVHVYAQHTSDRLSTYTPFKLDDKDIMAMQSICGYESAITGKTSKLCGIFSDAEWMSYEYAWDLRYAHMVGPINPMSNYLGIPWLKAQNDIFQKIDRAEHHNATFDIHGAIVDDNEPTHNESDSSPGRWSPRQRFFLAFTHREVPPLIATVLGIFNSSFEARGQFPTDHVVWTRAWKMADLIPFLGHVGLEKMTCYSPGLEGEYVRVIANTAPRPIPKCQYGPGASCGLQDFANIIKEGVSEFGAWRDVCGMNQTSWSH